MPSSETQFQKGQSGNPGGRPKRPWTWASLYEEEVEKQLSSTDGSKINAKSAVARRLVKMAVEGDIQAIKELTNRMDGMPTQPIEQSGEVNLNIGGMLDKIYGSTPTEPTGTT